MISFNCLRILLAEDDRYLSKFNNRYFRRPLEFFPHWWDFLKHHPISDPRWIPTAYAVTYEHDKTAISEMTKILTGSIKQSQCVGFSADHDRDGIVVEHGWHVLRREFVGRVGDEQAGLTDGTVAYHDALYRLHPSVWS